MYKDNKNGISVKLILDTRQKNKTGLFPIRVQVIAKRVAKYYNTGKLMNETDWEKLPDSRIKELAKVRISVKDTFDLVLKCIE